MIERGIHNKLNSPSAIQLYRLGLSKKFKSHKPALDHKPGSGVGAAYRAHDSNSPNEVSFIASSEWVGLGKIVVPLRTAAGFRRLRRQN